MGEIVVSAIVVEHPERPELLMVRKRGTTSFMLPGGKPEVGESAVAAIVREAREELGLELVASELAFLGTFSAPAANEAGFEVTGHVFVASGVTVGLDVDAPRCLEEIEEVGWFSYVDLPADTAGRQFAPLTRDHVIPALVEAGLVGRR